MDKNLKNIKLFICDVDGILTDGQFIKDTAGEESKSFNVLDGVGFVMLRLLDLGIKTAWITGRESATTESRAEELQIDDVYNGVIRKIDSYNELKKKYNKLLWKEKEVIVRKRSKNSGDQLLNCKK